MIKIALQAKTIPSEVSFDIKLKMSFKKTLVGKNIIEHKIRRKILFWDKNVWIFSLLSLRKTQKFSKFIILFLFFFPGSKILPSNSLPDKYYSACLDRSVSLPQILFSKFKFKVILYRFTRIDMTSKLNGNAWYYVT